MERKKLDFDFYDLYEMRDDIEKLFGEDSEDSTYLETLNNVIDFLEKTDRDRDKREYRYKVSYDNKLLDYANSKNIGHKLARLHYNILGDCDWDESIPQKAKIDDTEIKLIVDIDDETQIIVIHMFL